MNENRSANDIFRLEHEVVTQYCIISYFTEHLE